MIDLRKKSKSDLMEQVEKLKEELHQLRVAQVSGGAPAKVAMIRTTRKNIARIYTIISQITKQKVREQYQKTGNKLLPLDLRPKLTRRERLALPKHLRNKKTPKQKRLCRKYPKRKFAVIHQDFALPLDVVQSNVKAVLSARKDSRYRHYLIKKQKAIAFMQKTGRYQRMNMIRKRVRKRNKEKAAKKAAAAAKGVKKDGAKKKKTTPKKKKKQKKETAPKNTEAPKKAQTEQ